MQQDEPSFGGGPQGDDGRYHAPGSAAADFADPATMPSAPTSQTVRSVSFKLDQGDLRAFDKAALARTARWLPPLLRAPIPYLILGVAILVIVMLVLLVPPFAGLRPNPFFWTTLLCLALFGWQAIETLRRRRALTPLPNGALLGTKTIDVETDGFTLTENGSQRACLWSNVLDIIETDQHLILFMDSGSGQVIPRDAFLNPVEAQKFAAFCRECNYVARSR